MEIITHYGMIFIILSIMLCFYATWNTGANDVANAMGTAVGSGAIGVKKAIIIAIIFEALGALLAGSTVTDTLQNGLLHGAAFTAQPEWLVYGMLAALLATSSWLVLATAWGWPVSTTQAIVGAIAGFAFLTTGSHAVQWNQVGTILLAWLLTPMIGGLLAWLLMKIAPVVAWLGRGTTTRGEGETEKIFASLIVFAGAAMAFAHGANDVANGVAPMAAVIATVRSGGDVMRHDLPLWALAIGTLGIVTGLATYGYRIMETIGSKMTELTPIRGFCATLAAAITVLIASRMGLPVSTTHIAIASIFGAGVPRGTATLDFRVMSGIVTSWMVTLPTVAVLSALFFTLFRWLFS
ncbi:MAG: inorganic phosphate transporter [Magnetococcales bacterium]|nr:inorganic phosphate transporter [Magnetococcales bacterium]